MYWVERMRERNVATKLKTEQVITFKSHFSRLNNLRLRLRHLIYFLSGKAALNFSNIFMLNISSFLLLPKRERLIVSLLAFPTERQTT